MSETTHPSDPPVPRGPRSARARWLLASLALHGTALAAFAAFGGLGGGARVPSPRVTLDWSVRDVALAPDPVELAPPPPEVLRPADDPPEPDLTPETELPAWPAAIVPADATASPATIGLGPWDRRGNVRAGRGVAGVRGTPAPDPPAEIRPAALPDPAPAARGPTQTPRFAAPPAPPAYPATARRRGWEGVVRLRLVVAADGTVADVRVLESSGRDVLDDAAVHTARAWRFEPALDDGAAVSGTIDVPVRFRLES